MDQTHHILYFSLKILRHTSETVNYAKTILLNGINAAGFVSNLKQKNLLGMTQCIQSTIFFDLWLFIRMILIETGIFLAIS